ncbi:MAG: radical SAM protein [Selenomonadaceae bacterium]|nr:radical SAM protein [Selenomonadaceae bacterium]
MLDILFLNLHRRYLANEKTHGGFLGIYLLAAFVRQEGYAAKSFSGTLEAGFRHVEKFCAEKKISMVGLYCDYDNVTENIFLSRHVKEKYNLPVIIGGPQATALDENFFRESKCDAVVRYEGELTVLDLMNFYLEEVGALEKILGISYLHGDELIKNPERPPIKNLDALPLIDEACYLEPENFFMDFSLMTGRGCPFHCAFCHEGAHTRAVRFRSVENVLTEIDARLKNHSNDDEIYILFTDDTFTLNAERVKKICAGLAERRKKYNFKFFCEGHIHTLYKNPEMIRDLAAAGCVRIQLGIEAGTAKVLKAYGKQSMPEEIFKVVRLCRDAGIQQTYSNIILGGAHFSREVFEADKKFVLELLEESQGTVEIGTVTYWPLPETKMTRCPEEFEIKICDAEFLTSVGDFPQTETPELDRLTIAEMQREFQQAISAKMVDMLENWRVPTERILSWLSNSRQITHQGYWYAELLQRKFLFAYYEMLKLGEGFHSSQVENLSTAHPLRIVPLYKYLRRIDKTTVEICGEKLSDVETEILLLSTGKLSVEEISKRVSQNVSEVLKFLNRLERRHLIVYTLH